MNITNIKPNWNGSTTGSYGFWWWDESYVHSKEQVGGWKWEDTPILPPHIRQSFVRRGPATASPREKLLKRLLHSWKDSLWVGLLCVVVGFLMGFYISTEEETMPPQVEYPLPMPSRK
jgi:hypothetical protein